MSVITVWCSTHSPFSLFLITVSIIVIILGSLIRYCIGMIIQIPIFWLQKVENLERLEFSFFGIARFPRQAFPQPMGHIFTLIIPVMLVAAVPAEIVLGKLPQYSLFLLALFTIFLLWLTNSFFSFALKRYSSASS